MAEEKVIAEGVYSENESSIFEKDEEFCIVEPAVNDISLESILHKYIGKRIRITEVTE